MGNAAPAEIGWEQARRLGARPAPVRRLLPRPARDARPRRQAPRPSQSPDSSKPPEASPEPASCPQRERAAACAPQAAPAPQAEADSAQSAARRAEEAPEEEERRSSRLTSGWSICTVLSDSGSLWGAVQGAHCALCRPIGLVNRGQGRFDATLGRERPVLGLTVVPRMPAVPSRAGRCAARRCTGSRHVEPCASVPGPRRVAKARSRGVSRARRTLTSKPAGDGGASRLSLQVLKHSVKRLTGRKSLKEKSCWSTGPRAASAPRGLLH